MTNELSPVGKPKPTCLIASDASFESGNAFAILARVTRALRNNGYTGVEIEQYRADATSGDYDHLLDVTLDWVDPV